ncbi:hypothetical protein Tdes44962_MAKER03292 [Teratosphaeria destructans]|uniref:Uncharacterized protein n=1 Tax=Teratosphaeria destructans TaxID=418781 RepID=A0A9W7W1W8_9PEZI|nr:hypothetical protein Tdes44962_MAKER03292 [Teratosphaeria destructans]
MASNTPNTAGTASGQQTNVWQTAGRGKSRNPQNRSGTASPNPQTAQNTSAPPPRQDSARPAQQQLHGVWASRSSSAGASNGPVTAQQSRQDESLEPMNGFNRDEVDIFMGRDAGAVMYKHEEDGKAARGKPENMATGQAFLANLAKQIAKLEQGG